MKTSAILMVNQLARRAFFFVSCVFCLLDELEAASAYFSFIFR